MQPNDTIKEILDADVTNDRTALQVFNYAPSRLQTKWGTSANVPLYLFTSLRELLLGAAASPSDLSAAIVAMFGLGDTPSRTSVCILTLPVESVEGDQSPAIDQAGAEFAKVKILSQIHPDGQDADKDKLEQVDLRIRYLIDVLWRQKRAEYQRKVNSVTFAPALVGTDPTIDYDTSAKPFVCRWRGWLDNDTAISKVSLYSAEYWRIVL